MTIYFNLGYTPETRKIADYEIKGISLGERGRGRYELFIPCADNIPEKLGGYLPGLKLGLTKSNRPRIVPGDDPKMVSLILEAAGGYRRGSWGTVKYLKGSDVQLLGKGNGAFGDAGRIGGWDAVACNLKKGWIRIRKSGHSTCSEYDGICPDGQFRNFPSLDELIYLFDNAGWELPFSLSDERGIVAEEWVDVTSLPLPEIIKKPAEK